VPRSVRLAEAPSHGMPITAYAPTSPGGVAYKALAEELLRGDQPVAPNEPVVAQAPAADETSASTVAEPGEQAASIDTPSTASADAAGPSHVGDAVHEGPVVS